MIELLSNFGFWLAVILGLMGFAALVLVGIRTSSRDPDYPGGARERVRDELIIRLPFVPAFSILVFFGLTPALLPSPLWLLAFGACVLGAAGCRFLIPLFRRSDVRLKAFHEARRAMEPAQ